MISDIKNPYPLNATPSGAISTWRYLADVRNISNMYPYGKSYPAAATYSADGDYRYGFNGMEKAREIDENTNYTHFRNLDLDYISWWSPDPEEKSQPFQSPYTSMNSNPIMLIDPRGDKAWEVTNEWNHEFISEFNEYTKMAGIAYYSLKSEFTCEDFALNIAVTFAKNNNLPFKYKTGDEDFDASNDNYNDFDDFRLELLRKSGARDMQRPENTIPLPNYYDATGGTMILNRNNDNIAYHVQMIVETSGSIVSNDYAFSIFQGNSYVGSSDPTSILYTGVSVQYGVLFPNRDYYTNTSTGSVLENFSLNNNIEFRNYNFLKMNELGSTNDEINTDEEN